MTLVVTPASPTVKSGTWVNYRIRYSCSGVGATCSGAELVAERPAGAVGAPEMTGSAHVASTQSRGNGQAVFRFADELPTGSSGDVFVGWWVQNDFVPDGSVLTTDVSLTGRNLTPTSVTGQSTVVASVDLDLKQAPSAANPPLDSDVSYRVYPCDLTYGAEGSLALVNAVLVEQLPAGAVFVSATRGGVYDQATRRITWPALSESSSPLLRRNECDNPGSRLYDFVYDFTVRYPSSVFSDTSEVTIVGTIVGQPFGAPAGVTVTDTVTTTHALFAPRVGHDFKKTAYGSGVRMGANGSALIPRGSLFWWTAHVDNTGNIPMRIRVADALPCPTTSPAAGAPLCTTPGFEPTGFWFWGERPNRFFWTTTTGSTGTAPVPPGDAYWIDISVLGLPSGAKLAVIGVDYDSLGAGKSSEWALVGRPSSAVAHSALTMTDCDTAVITFSNGRVVNDSDCATVEFVDPSPFPGLSLAPVTSALNRSPGQTTDWGLAFQNNGDASDDWTPSIAVVVPAEIEFLSATVAYDDLAAVLRNPVMSQTSLPSGETVVRWTFDRYDLAPDGPNSTIWFSTRVRPGTQPGDLEIKALGADAYRAVRQSWNLVADAYDVDLDGDLAETLSETNAEVTVASSAAVVGLLWTRGTYDTEYGPLGMTAPGSSVDYRFRLVNEGNVAVDRVVAYTVLPSVGDTGISETQYTVPRGSEWSPFMTVAPVAPPGVTVEYSTSGNPCRPEVAPSGPVGCVSDWTTTPPAVLSDVRALRFSTAAGTLVQPGAAIDVEWTMTVPASTPLASSAFNSLAFAAQRADDGIILGPAEPAKTGVRVPVADLSVSKVAPETVFVGEIVDVVVRVRNTGPDASNGVEIVDTIPAWLSVNSSTASIGSFDPATGVWSMPTIASGETATLTYKALVLEAGVTDGVVQSMVQPVPDPDSTPGNGVVTEDDYDAVAMVAILSRLGAT